MQAVWEPLGNAKCGDIMRIYLDIDENQIIQDVKFKTFDVELRLLQAVWQQNWSKEKVFMRRCR